MGCALPLQKIRLDNVKFTTAAGGGTTVIENAAREPEIVDLATCLRKMGAQNVAVLKGGMAARPAKPLPRSRCNSRVSAWSSR